MKTCKKCNETKFITDFYNTDSTCKECRKEMVRENRARNADYYRAYDKKRFKDDPRVRDRHSRYQKTPAGIEASNKAKLNWASRNPIKTAAARMVGNHVKGGKILKPSTCSVCGSYGRIHGHHDDYAYPLVVRWLCSKCHTAWHHENGEGLNAT